jgi:hypothetical protein
VAPDRLALDAVERRYPSCIEVAVCGEIGDRQRVECIEIACGRL